MKRAHDYQQHFLKSPRLVAELIGHSNIRKNDVVYDLGAGSGVISAVLARRAKEVIAVETEPRTLKLLEKNLANLENTKIVRKDLLTLPMPEKPYKIFSNIPFSLSSAVVQMFAFSDYPPKAIYLIVQKQFARKLVPSRQHFNSLLGAQLWPWWRIRIRKPLRRSDFTPPPAVDTVLLELRPVEESLLSKVEQPRYHSFVDRCFSDQKYFSKLNKEQANISPERKPSELSPEDWVNLFHAHIKLN